MYIRLRSVLRGPSMSSQAHFTAYLYTPTWVFLCLFLGKVVVDLEIKQADVSTHVFFVCSNHQCNNHLTFGCLSEQ
jgi:hypothetical protein